MKGRIGRPTQLRNAADAGVTLTKKDSWRMARERRQRRRAVQTQTLRGKRDMQPRLVKKKTDDDPAWIKCPDCDDYWCVVHELHAYDCPCPPIEEWGDANPYFDRYPKP